MIDKLDYLFGSFNPAIEALATDPGDARARVKRAYINLRHLMPEQLPPEIRDDFAWAVSQVTHRLLKRSEEDDSRLDATFRRMTNATAAKIAARLFRCYRRLLDLAYQARPGTHFPLA